MRKIICDPLRSPRESLWSLDHQDYNFFFALALSLPSCVEVFVLRERSCILPVLSCNSSVEVPLWKVLCGHSGNPSVWKRGRRVVVRTSKHIPVFVFDLFTFSLFYIFHCLTLFISYTCLVLFVCPHLCWTKRASNRTSTLNLEESRGVVPEPFTENSGSLLVAHSVLAIKF